MGERWDRDRFMYERSRDQARFDDDRDRYQMRDARGRDHSVDERRFNRSLDDDDMIRDRRWTGHEPRPMPRRDPLGPEYARRVVMERERERDFGPRRDSPPSRPGFLRRQSSLDTFDRRPRIFHDREEYPPPARREDIRRDDYRAPPYTPIPLPKTRGLPPPRRYPDQGFYDDIKVAEPDYYGDDDFRPYPDRIREREFARTRRRRSHSRDSFSTRTRSHRSSSISSATSSHSSSSSGGTTVRSEYPKKGKTRIPAKLVSKRALIDLGYPFFEEGNTIIVQKALGQENIDELLKVSEDYKKVEAEIAAARAPPAALPAPPAPASKAPPAATRPAQAPTQAPPSQAPQSHAPQNNAPQGYAPPVQAPPAQAPKPQAPQSHAPAPTHYKEVDIKETIIEKSGPPPEPKKAEPKPGPPRPQVAPKAPEVKRDVPPPAPPAPVIVNAAPPVPMETFEEMYRDYSPSRSSSSSSWDSRSHSRSHSHSHRRHRRKSVGALVGRSRSRSRSGREIRSEIRALERELAHRPKHDSGREIVRAERLADGQVVIYEEKLEKVVEHHKPPRIEKDKKGPPPALLRAMLKTLT